MGTLSVINMASASGAEAQALSIPEIQGAAHRSAEDGNQVTTTGVVTAAKADGYWLQDPDGDGDPTTSDGIFVYVGADGQQPDVGSSIELSGTVDEYRPGSADGSNLAITELTNTSFSELAKPLAAPEPVLLGSGGRVAPAQNADSAASGDGHTDVENPDAEFRPNRDAVDFYETLEGMLVQVEDAEVVGPTNSYGELTVLPGGTTKLRRTDAGGVRYGGYAKPNTQRLTIEDDVTDHQDGTPMPAANVGDRLPGAVSGPLHYDFGTFRFYPLEPPTVNTGDTKPESTQPAKDNELAVATFNVENLDPTDPQAKFDGLADAIVRNLAAPDVLALEEVQDNTGAECPDGGCTPDGVVGAGRTMAKLIRAIENAGGPTYEFTQISPKNGEDGGEPTGNIREVFLYRTDRGLEFVERDHGRATTPAKVVKVDGAARLARSPARVDPANEAWNSSRKPLVGEFRFEGETLFLIADHFASKGGDEPIMGRWQPPARTSEDQRHAQARLVHDFVAEIRSVQQDAKVIVLGDINDFEFSRATNILTQDQLLIDLPRQLPAKQRYSYVYQGNSQVLDHILVNPAVHAGLQSYDSVHINSDFANQLSDHDPQVMRITVG